MNIKRTMFSRRTVLAGFGAATLTSTHRAFATPAQAQGNKLLLVILRGALDGLAAIPPINDARLREFRPNITPKGTRAIDQGFALHPALANVHALYNQGEAAVIHAVGGPYRERSHFMAQDLLESGTHAQITADGWLNRALQLAPTPLTAISIGTSLPLILRGEAGAASWSPPVFPEAENDTIARLQDLYRDDDALGTALTQALNLDKKADGMSKEKMSGGRGDAALIEAGARLLAGDNGADIAVVSVGGWDTHAGQAGTLQRGLGNLDAALMRTKSILQSNWSNTTIAIFTEFGRTVRENGSRGTDHGTGGAAILVGGALKGRRLLGDWPGLEPDALFENRDLYPANDIRGVFASILTERFGLARRDIERHVFPQSAGLRLINPYA